MKNKSEVVERIIKYCLFKDEEVIDKNIIGNNIKVEGIINIYMFNIKRIEESKPEIKEILEDMQDTFFFNKGGDTFLNLCEDRHGELWTGLHYRVEELVVLGIAAGYIEYKFANREMWKMFPGEMPHLYIDLREKET